MLEQELLGKLKVSQNAQVKVFNMLEGVMYDQQFSVSKRVRDRLLKEDGASDTVSSASYGGIPQGANQKSQRTDVKISKPQLVAKPEPFESTKFIHKPESKKFISEARLQNEHMETGGTQGKAPNEDIKNA